MLGVQATPGKRPESIDGLSDEDPILRLLPVNVFSRAFFREKLDLIEKEEKEQVALKHLRVIAIHAEPPSTLELSHFESGDLTFIRKQGYEKTMAAIDDCLK